MENLPFEIDNNDYVKLPRSIKTALVDGYLRFEEYSVLVWPSEWILFLVLCTPSSSHEDMVLPSLSLLCTLVL